MAVAFTQIDFSIVSNYLRLLKENAEQEGWKVWHTVSRKLLFLDHNFVSICVWKVISVTYPGKRNTKARTIEFPKCAHIFKVNCCLKVHNAHFKIASPIRDKPFRTSVMTCSTRDSKSCAFLSFTGQDDTSCLCTQFVRRSRARSRRYVPFKKEIILCLYYRPQVWGKVIFLHLFAILFTRGVCLSACWDTTPPRTRPPWDHAPPPSGPGTSP